LYLAQVFTRLQLFYALITFEDTVLFSNHLKHNPYWGLNSYKINVIVQSHINLNFDDVVL